MSPQFQRALLAAALTAGVVSAHAEELTLQQALAEANASSPKLQRAESAAEAASWRVSEAWSGFLPKVSANATHLLAKEYLLTDIAFGGSPVPVSIPQIIPGTTFGLNFQMPLFDGFVSWKRLSSAKSFRDSASDESSWIRFQLQREIKSLFYRVLGAQDLREVADRNLKTIEEHLRDVKNFKEVGISTNFDVLRVEAQASAAQTDLLDASDGIVTARNRLAEAMGKEAITVELKGRLPEPNEKWIDELKEFDMAERRDLNALQSKTEAAASMDAANGRYWIPNVSLFGQYLKYNNKTDAFSDFDNLRNSYQVGLQASWNIFDGMSSIAKSRQAAEERFQAEKSLQIARLHARQDFDLWKRKFLHQCAVYKARLEDVQKATESVRLAKAGRKAGIRTNSELLDAETDLFKARAGVVNAQMGAVEALLNLELASGRELEGI